MNPLLPGLRAEGEAGRYNRGDVWWADPHFPGTGKSDKPHMCLLLRTPRPREVNVPVLTLHTLDRKPDAINDCCMELEPKSYKPIKVATVIDARMTMFVPVLMLTKLSFIMKPDDVSEIEDCLFVALDLTDE